jgi:hypothetical protein
MGAFLTRHLHHQRGLQHKDRLTLAPPGTSLGENLVDQALEKNKHFPLAHCTQGHPHLGQPHQKRFYRALHFPSMLERLRITKSSAHSLLLQLTNLGSLCLNHAHHRLQVRRPQGDLRRMERLSLSVSHPKPYLAATSRLHSLAALEREKQMNFPFVSA